MSETKKTYKVTVRDSGILSLLREMQKQNMLNIEEDLREIRKETDWSRFRGIINLTQKEEQEFLDYVKEGRKGKYE